jgi:hypothetical protein
VEEPRLIIMAVNIMLTVVHTSPSNPRDMLSKVGILNRKFSFRMNDVAGSVLCAAATKQHANPVCILSVHDSYGRNSSFNRSSSTFPQASMLFLPAASIFEALRLSTKFVPQVP